MNPIVPVILCVGGDTRLWPHNRHARLKPFLPLLGERTLFERAGDRVADAQAFAKPTVFVGEGRVRLVREKGEHALSIIAEPIGRNTAPTIGLAALRAPERSVLLIYPSYHHIPDATVFCKAAQSAAALARWVAPLITKKMA